MTTKTATKSASKKTSKTSARRKPAAKAAKVAQRAPRFAPTAKFTVTKENPRRPGTVQFDRYAVLAKLSGKTVADLPEKDHTGLVLALRYAVAGGHAKVAGA